ncbi:iron complex transport system substrate-binding protein [Paenibacillus rhizosphaerae]|uniref:Iron complex transport system substrate-binding protein n=1 Tax=Paenibacillus rhizosphaerae TaxID=297318 RepID=A0A839TSI3_9BACL|nr:iron-siderophore ABC transporter substrate-binding protein [Paenibacillus rhizosphaerae]MBB3128620.1 iron complex transport system substrate-binding protein [Paenibacillus rhizosphaerae]
MTGKKRRLLFLLLVLSAALSGCASHTTKPSASVVGNGTETAAASESKNIAVKHEWGTIELKETPQRVVTLDFSFIDTLTSLGVTPIGNAGVGTTKIPEYLQDQVTGVTDVGERKAPNLEVVQSLNPDLIIASVDRHSMIREDLTDIAPTAAFDDASLQQVLDNVHSLGTLVGKPEAAKGVIDGLKDKISMVRDQIEVAPTMVVAGFFDDDFTVWVKHSFIGSLLSEAGVNYAFDGEIANLEGKGEGATVTLERLHELNPDYILVYGDNPDKLQTNPLYQDLKAVKEHHFISVDRNLWSRGRGPIAANRILDELLAILSPQSASE